MNQNHSFSSSVSTTWPANAPSPLSSTCSVMSDSSYMTALGSVTDRMKISQSKFTEVKRRENRGRSKRNALAETIESRPLVGFGRGRPRVHGSELNSHR